MAHKSNQLKQEVYIDGKRYISDTGLTVGWTIATAAIILLLILLTAAINVVDNKNQELTAAYKIIESCTGHKPGAYQLVDAAGAVEDFMCSSISTGARKGEKR